MNGFELLKRDFAGDLSRREHRSRIAAKLAVTETAKSPIVAAVAVFSLTLASTSHFGLLLLAPTLAFALTYWLKRRCERIARLAEAHDDAKAISIPEAVWYSDPGAKQAIRRLAEARQEFAYAVSDGPRHPDGVLVPHLRGVRDVERRIVVLAARVEYLGLALQRVSITDIETAAQRVQAQASAAPNDDARATRRIVAAQRERQLADARAIETKRQQLLISLDCMLSMLETLPLKLTRLQLSTVEAAEGNGPDPGDQAGSLLGEIDAIEEVFTPMKAIDAVEETRRMVE
jgi:hypothetical protein